MGILLRDLFFTSTYTIRKEKTIHSLEDEKMADNQEAICHIKDRKGLHNQI